MRYPGNVVTAGDTRSKGRGTPDKCFYCSGLIGKEHDVECVCIDRPVKMRFVLELVIAVPRSWTQDEINFRYQESSWCADNLLSQIKRHTAGPDDDKLCLCSRTDAVYIGEATMEEALTAGLVADSDGD